jgi:drug/metabolite transporter (DMT)-like permease
MPLWIALLAPILIGERLTVPRAIAALLGFIGVLIVVRPHESSISAGTLAILAAACLYAFSVIWVRSLTRTERPIQILFWMTLIQTGLGILINIHDLHLPPQSAWGFLLLIALAGLAAHYFMARAFALADTMVVMPIDFLRLPLAAGLGALLYGEGLDPWVLAGGALIILGNYWNLKAEHRTRTRI